MEKLANRGAGDGRVHVRMERHSNTLCGTSPLTLEDAGIDALVTCPRCLDSRNWTGTMKAIQALVDDGGRIEENDQGRLFTVTATGSRMPVSRENVDAMRSMWAGRGALAEVADG